MLAKDDLFFDKALAGFTMFALNQGEVCTCSSRALVQESIYERFMERAVKRVEADKQGNPLDMQTMIGAQASLTASWRRRPMLSSSYLNGTGSSLQSPFRNIPALGGAGRTS